MDDYLLVNQEFFDANEKAIALAEANRMKMEQKSTTSNLCLWVNHDT